MDAFHAYLIEASGGSVWAGFARLKPEQMIEGDVTLRVRYASVNYKDALAASGEWKVIRRFPCVGGKRPVIPS
ncbi:hypothetical protein [Polaromonas sp. C04]|uniref:hypothetical protein n=1 Tax=Polaromonas sp. C04 TaxID=1945857 RepID=UPI0009855410|nr:hypothetical protein [Polaromonas sp. C04]OOG58008.1 hypothetical protein B0E49_04005 [Polaromonas sp. C04]